jgi:hypothetical protein
MPNATPTEPSPQLAPAPRPGIAMAQFQADQANPNHHLWNNHGIWFLHYTCYPTPVTKERVRRSLRTRCLEEARRRRDAFWAEMSGLRAAV